MNSCCSLPPTPLMLVLILSYVLRPYGRSDHHVAQSSSCLIGDKAAKLNAMLVNVPYIKSSSSLFFCPLICGSPSCCSSLSLVSLFPFLSLPRFLPDRW